MDPDEHLSSSLQKEIRLCQIFTSKRHPEKLLGIPNLSCVYKRLIETHAVLLCTYIISVLGTPPT